MRAIPLKAWILAAVSGGLQILVFPKFYMYFLCWIALVPLLYVLLRGPGGESAMVDSEGRSLRPFTLWQGFLLGWTSGIIWYFGTSYWVGPVMAGYGNLHWAVVGLIMIAAALAYGLHHAVFGLLVVMMARRSSLGNRRPLFLAPFFWVAIELYRDRVTAYPWLPLGGAQIDNVPFARIATFTGVYGLTFAVVLVNCAFVAALLLTGRRRTNLLISACAAAIALQMGVFAKSEQFSATRQAVLVQENVPVLDLVQWTPQYYDQNIASLAQLSVETSKKQAGAHKPGLIVWPETPAPFITTDPRLQYWLTEIARDTNSFMIVGAVGVANTSAPPEEQTVYNSAVVIDPQGRVAGRYDKIHLVPYGEYVPFKDVLFFARKLTREVGNFTKGTERKVFDVDGSRASVAICYESIFPNEVRQFTLNGAQVLVNISNDGWYGESGAPFQHLQMARMRAIENHRWLLIDTNSGTTAAVDPYGRIVAQLDRNVRAALVAPYSPLNELTVYVRYGDFFAWTCVVISLLGVLVRWRIKAATMLEAPALDLEAPTV